MGSKGDGFLRDTFHQASISAKSISVMVENVITVFGAQDSLGNGHTDSVGNTLTKRASGGLDTFGLEVLWMSGGSTSELSESLDVLESNIFVSRKIQKTVNEHRSMSS